MSYTDQLLKSICDKMDILIENQRQIERRLASLERSCSPQSHTGLIQHHKVKISVQKPEQE